MTYVESISESVSSDTCVGTHDGDRGWSSLTPDLTTDGRQGYVDTLVIGRIVEKRRRDRPENFLSKIQSVTRDHIKSTNTNKDLGLR